MLLELFTFFSPEQNNEELLTTGTGHDQEISFLKNARL